MRRLRRFMRPSRLSCGASKLLSLQRLSQRRRRRKKAGSGACSAGVRARIKSSWGRQMTEMPLQTCEDLAPVSPVVPAVSARRAPAVSPLRFRGPVRARRVGVVLSAILLIRSLRPISLTKRPPVCHAGRGSGRKCGSPRRVAASASPLV